MDYQQFDFRQKVLFHVEHIRDYIEGKRPTALNMEIDLTNACNHRCVFCVWGNYIKENKATLPTDLVIRTLLELDDYQVKSINWTGGGEPLLHKNFYKILDRSFNLGFENGLMTNGSLFKSEHNLQVIEQLIWLRVSMAGGDSDSYLKNQGKNDFNKVMLNIESLVKDNVKQSKQTSIGVALLVRKSNYHTILNFAQRLCDMGVEYLQIRPDMFADAAEMKWWTEEVLPICEEAKALTSKHSFKILGTKYKEDQIDLDYASKCHAHHFVMAINAEGKVCFCKNTREKEKFHIGDLNKSTFKDIWENNDLLNKLEHNTIPSNCNTFCKNLAINNAIEDCIQGKVKVKGHDVDPPANVNFL